MGWPRADLQGLWLGTHTGWPLLFSALTLWHGPSMLSFFFFLTKGLGGTAFLGKGPGEKGTVGLSPSPALCSSLLSMPPAQACRVRG